MNVKGLEMNASTYSVVARPDCAAANRVSAKTFSLNLPGQAVVTLPDAANVRSACVEGIVWITLDNDPRDIVLESCDVFTTPEHRRAIICAMKPSTITVATPATAPTGQREHAHGLVLQMKLT